MRLLAVLLMCAATVCFSGIDSSAKWLGMRLPEVEVVWARYVGAAILSVMVARPWSRPQVFHANRPGLQLFRSLLRRLPGARAMASVDGAALVTALRWPI